MATATAERSAHPLVRRNYRVATSAIEGFVDLVERCLRVHMPGALIYARPRIGKTHAVDYLCLHLARDQPIGSLSKGRSSARSSLLRVGRVML